MIKYSVKSQTIMFLITDGQISENQKFNHYIYSAFSYSGIANRIFF